MDNILLCTCSPQTFIHLSIDGYLDCFLTMAFMKELSLNTGVILQSCGDLIFTGYLPTRGTEGFCANSAFNFSWNFHTVSYKAPISMLKPQYRILFSPTPPTHFFCANSNLNEVQSSDISMFLTFISLMMCDLGYFIYNYYTQK